MKCFVTVNISKSEKYLGHMELSYVVNDIIKGPD